MEEGGSGQPQVVPPRFSLFVSARHALHRYVSAESRRKARAEGAGLREEEGLKEPARDGCLWDGGYA